MQNILINKNEDHFHMGRFRRTLRSSFRLFVLCLKIANIELKSDVYSLPVYFFYLQKSYSEYHI